MGAQEEVPASDLPDEALHGQEVPSDDMPDMAGREVPASDLPDDTLQQDHGSLGEQAKTVVEQGAQGIAGPLAKGFETMPVPKAGTWQDAALNVFPQLGLVKKVIGQVNPQDIDARAEANPIEAMGSKIGGEAAFMALTPELAAAKKATLLAKAGSSAIKGMIQMGMLSGRDEAEKYILGEGNPAGAVATNIIGSALGGGLIGGILGGVGNIASKVSGKALGKIGIQGRSFLTGFGHAAQDPAADYANALESLGETPDFDPKMFQEGNKFYKELLSKSIPAIGGIIGVERNKEHGFRGGVEGMLEGYLASKVLGHIIGPLVVRASKKIIAPLVMKVASQESFDGVEQAIAHANAIVKGDNVITKSLDSIFKGVAFDTAHTFVDEKHKEKLDQFIDDGGVDQQPSESAQGFAKGGEVAPQKNHIAEIWPDQNMLLSASRGRVSNYLKATKPRAGSKLTYDKTQVDPQKKREYDRARNIALNPLIVLKQVKDGTLTPSHMKDLNSMYPEVYQHLSQKMTERLAESETKGHEEKPPYKVRQALSLFLGAPLESSMTPSSIQAAQAVFANQKMGNQGMSQTKASALSKVGPNSMTDDQARERRLNKN